MTDSLPDTYRDSDGVEEVQGVFIKVAHTRGCPGFLERVRQLSSGRQVVEAFRCPECARQKVKPATPKPEERPQPWWADR